jgi:large subunit ribosomal protein L10
MMCLSCGFARLQAAFFVGHECEERRRGLAISRAKKEEMVARYLDVLESADGFFVAEYKAMTVAEAEQLRYKLRDSNGQYMVVKNTLLKHALTEANWPVPDDLLKGQTGIAFSNGNMPGVSKALMDFTKDFGAKFQVKGGVMGTSVFGADDLETISKMPSLPEIQAQLLGLLVAPASQLVGVVQAADAQIVNVLQPGVAGVLNVLNAHIEQNLKGDGGEDAA